MRNEELDILLEKYYKGESTKEEENALRSFFSGTIVPEGYETEKAIFSYFSEISEVPETASDFEARILAGVDESEKIIGLHKFRRFILPVLSAAAGLLILAGSYFFFVHRSEPRDTFSDPKLAYAEAMKILIDVSSKLNRGTRTLEPMSRFNEVSAESLKVINRSTKIVEKSLMNLNYLQKAQENYKLPLKKSENK